MGQKLTHQLEPEKNNNVAGTLHVLTEYHYETIRAALKAATVPIPYMSDYRTNTKLISEFRLYSAWPEEVQLVTQALMQNKVPVFCALPTGEQCLGYFDDTQLYVNKLSLINHVLSTDHWENQLAIIKQRKLLQLLQE